MHFLFFGVTTLGEDQTSSTLLKKANSAKNTRSRRILAFDVPRSRHENVRHTPARVCIPRESVRARDMI